MFSLFAKRIDHLTDNVLESGKNERFNLGDGLFQAPFAHTLLQIRPHRGLNRRPQVLVIRLVKMRRQVVETALPGRKLRPGIVHVQRHAPHSVHHILHPVHALESLPVEAHFTELGLELGENVVALAAADDARHCLQSVAELDVEIAPHDQRLHLVLKLCALV